MAHEDPPFRPDVPSMEMKPEYIELMVDCWNDEPEERPHFYRIVERLKKESGRYISVKYINFFFIILTVLRHTFGITNMHVTPPPAKKKDSL